MIILTANNQVSSLAAPITNSQTTLSVAPGAGAGFPQPAANQYFVLSIVDAATGQLREIMHVTNVTGDVFTIVRAQEGTAARAYALNDPVANLWTSGQFAALAQTASLGSAAYLNASDQIGGISAIQPFAGGNPNGFVAGNAATSLVPPSMVWDETNQLIWICTVTGTPTTASWIALDYQQGVVFCGTSTGTPNAQILTPTVPITGYSQGLALSFVAGFTNTGALTVNCSNKGSVNVLKESPTGPIPLTGGEVVTGNLISIRNDGTNFQLTATELGTMSLLNQGNTIINPGTGNAEISSPMGATITGSTYAILAAQRGYSIKRSNAAVAMTDTLPAIGGIANGWWVTVLNVDVSANDTISAPAGVALNGTIGGTVGLASGQSVRIGFDGSGYWVTSQPVSKLVASQFSYLSIANAGQTIAPGQYEVDSSGGAFSILLELVPVIGDNYFFRDFARTWAKFPVTLNGNGTNINGASTSKLDVSGASAQLSYFTNWNYQ